MNLNKSTSPPPLATLTTLTQKDMYDLDIAKDPDIHDRIDEIVARINFGFMLFGIFGNFLCILVLMQKNLLNRKFNWYLLLLAVADLVFCVIVFTNYYIVLTNQASALYDHSWITCYFTDYVVNSLDAFCVFLTLILSVDRLYAIIRPIQNKMFFTYRYPKRIAVFGYLALLLIKSPELFLSQRKYVASNEFVNSSSFDPTTSNTEIRESPAREYYCHNIDLTESSTISEHKGNTTPLIIYILYCNIFIPLLFNIIPALIILALNLTLWCFIRHYTNMSHISNLNHNRSMSTGSTATVAANQTMRNRVSTTSTANGSVNSATMSNASYLTALSKSRVTKAQKSYYFTIIMLGIWLLLTTIPYYSTYTYYWAKSLKFINDRSRVHLTVQAISSAFFNSNHCINIIIYLLFHKDFRSNALLLVCQLFNLNPLCKINPHYFASSSRNTNDRNTAKARRYQPEVSCTTMLAQQHTVRICEPSAKDIHLITDKPILPKRSFNKECGSPHELKSCLNGGGILSQQIRRLSLKPESEPNQTGEASSKSGNHLAPRSGSGGTIEMKQKRPLGKRTFDDTRLFIPNRKIFRCVGDDKRFSIDDLYNGEKQKLSVDASSVASGGKLKPPTPRKSFWTMFYNLGIFSRKK